MIDSKNISNVDDMLKELEFEHESEIKHNGFLDFNEEQVMDNFTFRHSQHKDYSYAVSFRNNEKSSKEKVIQLQLKKEE